MPNILLSLALFCIVSVIQGIKFEDNCYLGSPSSYLKWVENDGSLVFPQYRYKDETDIKARKTNENDLDESKELSELSGQWINIVNSSSCVIYAEDNILKCEGESVVSLPLPENVNINYIKEYVVLFASLAPLPPSSFKGLNIGDLIIQNSSLTYLSDDVFKNIKSLNTLTLSGNNISTLNDVEILFKHISSIKAVYLEANQLRNLNCYTHNDNNLKFLENLELLSLADNPLALVDFQCLNQSRLIYLNLKGVYIDENQAQSMGFSTLPKTLTTVDFSFSTVSNTALNYILYMLSNHNITTLSLAGLGLVTIPIDSLKYVRHSLRYLSLYGNWFDDNIFYSRMESTYHVEFQELQELDLRSCKIETLGSSVLSYFPNLIKLSLEDNELHIIEPNLLTFSPSLEYLDISKNKEDLLFSYTEIIQTATPTTNPYTSTTNPYTSTTNPYTSTTNPYTSTTSSLKVLKLAHNIFSSYQNWSSYFEMLQLLSKLEVLSLCNSTLNVKNISPLTTLLNLKSLDLSNTLKSDTGHVLKSAYQNIFYSLYSLQELQFVDNGFNFDNTFVSMFAPLQSLALLNLTLNFASVLQEKMFYNLTNLKVLLLCDNSISSWNTEIFCENNHLQQIDLSGNKINLITQSMVKDFEDLKLLNLKSNPLICDKLTNSVICGNQPKSKKLKIENWQEYVCLDLIENEYLSYYNDSSLCNDSKSVPVGSPPRNNENIVMIVILIPLGCFIAVIIAMKMDWWNIRHYIILAKNTSTAFLLKNSHSNMNNHTFVYDVFVSYSDIDRTWVLDYLIPNIEKESSLSVCFHERDFQVGLSILENIIECMSKSRCLLLVISESFVKSRWCQFEMHLAQHHAVETKKEQLVMVLLENIPKKDRPKTLHHLMCSRTYLIWPKQPSKEDLIELFWKRLYRAIKHGSNDTPIYIND